MTVSFLASHGGSSARHIIESIRSGKIDAKVGCVITNNKNSAIYSWCEENMIPVVHISNKTHPAPQYEDQAISEILLSYDSDLIVLSGYMKMIGKITLNNFKNRILNVHPSLLPKYGGKGMYGDRVHAAVLNSGDNVSGATVHFVNERYDEGEILKQAQVNLSVDETIDNLREKIQNLEDKLYVEAINQIIDDELLQLRAK